MITRGMRKNIKTNIIVKCINQTQIEQIEKIKYLGIIIDSKLRFEDHCIYF